MQSVRSDGLTEGAHMFDLDPRDYDRDDARRDPDHDTFDRDDNHRPDRGDRLDDGRHRDEDRRDDRDRYGQEREIDRLSNPPKPAHLRCAETAGRGSNISGK